MPNKKIHENRIVSYGSAPTPPESSPLYDPESSPLYDPESSPLYKNGTHFRIDPLLPYRTAIKLYGEEVERENLEPFSETRIRRGPKIPLTQEQEDAIVEKSLLPPICLNPPAAPVIEPLKKEDNVYQILVKKVKKFLWGENQELESDSISEVDSLETDFSDNENGYKIVKWVKTICSFKKTKLETKEEIPPYVTVMDMPTGKEGEWTHEEFLSALEKSQSYEIMQTLVLPAIEVLGDLPDIDKLTPKDKKSIFESFSDKERIDWDYERTVSERAYDILEDDRVIDSGLMKSFHEISQTNDFKSTKNSKIAARCTRVAKRKIFNSVASYSKSVLLEDKKKVCLENTSYHNTTSNKIYINDTSFPENVIIPDPDPSFTQRQKLMQELLDSLDSTLFPISKDQMMDLNRIMSCQKMPGRVLDNTSFPFKEVLPMSPEECVVRMSQGSGILPPSGSTMMELILMTLSGIAILGVFSWWCGPKLLMLTKASLVKVYCIVFSIIKYVRPAQGFTEIIIYELGIKINKLVIGGDSITTITHLASLKTYTIAEYILYLLETLP